MFNIEYLLRTGTKSCRAFRLIFSLVRRQMMIQSITLKQTSHDSSLYLKSFKKLKKIQLEV